MSLSKVWGHCTALFREFIKPRNPYIHRALHKNMLFQGADRIKGQGQSVWNEFTALAKNCNAVNIGQGFPDSSPPDFIADAFAAVASNPDFTMHQYTRGFGHVRLVNALSKMYSRLFNRPVNPLSEITITVGGYNALFSAFFALINPGDEVIVIEPFFDCYTSQIEMAGGTPVFVPLRLTPPKNKDAVTSADYKIDMDELASKFSSKTKLIVLNNPNNPLGKVFTREELTSIADLVKKHNVIVISDEVYEWLVYPGSEMIRFATLPNMWDRTITIGSAGKVFSVTGWKLGWAIAPEHLMSLLRALHQNCNYTCPTPTQEAVAIAFEKQLEIFDTPQSYFKQMAASLIKKREKMRIFLTEVGMKPIMPEGGYFMLADFSSLHGPFEDKCGDDPKDYRFARWMCKEKRLSGIPPTAFYSKGHRSMGENLIRFCFFKEDSTLDAAEKIIKEWNS